MFLRESTLEVVRSTTPATKQNDALEAVNRPTEYDILCGKDKTYAKHTGNQIFRSMIESWVVRYQAASSKQSKMKITKEIVSSMHEKHNSRFLRKISSTEWEEITDQVARDKVSHALRFAANGTSGSASKKRKASSHKRKESSTSISSEQGSQVTAASTVTAIDADLARQEKGIVEDLFCRQQAILQNLNREHACDDEVHAINGRQAEPEFNTLRSEDLDELMNEPLMEEGEWESVIKLAR